MKRIKQLICVILVITICMSLFPSAAFADGEALTEESTANTLDLDFETTGMLDGASEIITGSCGDNAIFELNRDTAELKITGTGSMAHWANTDEVPWSAYWDDIQIVTVADGITSITQYAFSEIWGLESLSVPASLKTIEDEAFSWVDSVTFEGHLIDWLRMLGDNSGWYGNLKCDTSNITESCGSKLTYTLDFSSGTLSISGTGSMTRWESVEDVPWYPVSSYFDTVTIADGVESISDYAFGDCRLQVVAIPASVTSIGESAFNWADTVRFGGNMLSWYQMNENTWWYSELICDTTTVTDSCGADLMYTIDFLTGSLEITGTGSMPRWKEDTDVPWYSFRDKIRTVIIGEEVTSITRYAFYGCNLDSITVPISVTTISDGAFGWADTVYYAGGTSEWYEMLGDNTGWFDNLQSGKSTAEGTCGTNLSYIVDFSDGKLTVSGTGSMARWMEDTKVPWYSVRGLIKSVIIEDGVTGITRYAFRGCSLEYISIPSSVTSIQEEAFGWADTVIYDGSTMDWFRLVGSNTGWYNELKSSGQSAEGDCGQNLHYAINYETGELLITGTGSMQEWKNVEEVPWYYSRDAINIVKIEDGATSITKYAFSECWLESITVPASVTDIANDSFGWTEKVYYGGSMFAWYNALSGYTGWFGQILSDDPIAEGACGENLAFHFDFDTGIMTISGSGSMDSWKKDPDVPWHYIRELINLVVVNDGAENISKYAFSDCYLNSITLPASIAAIDTEAFGWVEKVYFGGSMIDWYRMLSGDTGWFERVLSNNPYVTESFGSGLTWSFDFDSGVMTIAGDGKMPSWTAREDAPWHYIRNFIKTVIIEEGISYIGGFAFSDCSLLRISVPASVTEAAENAFENCWAERVDYGGRARVWFSLFRDSYWIERLSCVDSVLNGEEGLCGDDAFYVLDYDTGILSITGTGAINSEPWGNYENISAIVIGSGITEIGWYTFSGYPNLTRVTIPNTVKTIGEGSFSDHADELVICGGLNSAAAIYAIWNLIDFEAFSSDDSSYEDYAIDMDNTALYSTVAENAVVSGSIPVILNYAVRADKFSSVFEKRLYFRFTDNLELSEDGILLNGKLINNYTYDESSHILSVPVTNITGTIRFTLTPVESGRVAVCALFEYVQNGQDKTDAVGMLYLDAPLLKINAPNQTSASEVTVNGLCSVGETVIFYVDGVSAGSVKSKQDGSFSTKVKLSDSPVSGHTYRITARLKSDETAESVVSVLYEAGAPTLTKFVMYHSGGEVVDLMGTSGTRLTNTLVPGYPFKFVMEFSNPESLGNVYVSSTKSGVTNRMQAFPTDNPGEYIAEGYFYGTKEDYVPGVINVVYNLYVSEEEATAEITENELSEQFRNGEITIQEDTDTSFAYDYTLEDGTSISTRLTVLPVNDYLKSQGVLDAAPEGEVPLDGDAEAFAKLLSKLVIGYGEKVVTNGVNTIIINNDEDASFRYIVVDSAKDFVVDEVIKYGSQKALECILDETVPSKAVSAVYGVGKGIVKYNNYAADIQKTKERIESSSLSESEKAAALSEVNRIEWENKALGVARVLQPIGKVAINIGVGAAVKGAIAGSAAGPIGIIAGAAAGALFGIITSSLINLAQKNINDDLANYSALGEGTYLKWIIDPSGYVYDVATEERLPGVTVTAYCILLDEDDPEFWSTHPEPTEYGEIWNAEEYSQSNPTVTDIEGGYAWEVPEGWWRVKYEADGYETVWSDWMTVPPIQTEVNIGMIATNKLLVGDVNSDGAVDGADANMIIQYCVGLITWDAMNFAAADVDGDSLVTPADAASILARTN